MSSYNLIPLATTGPDQCKKCTLPISETQSFLQCQLCKRNIHSECVKVSKSNKQSHANNTDFTCENCSKCTICSKKVAKNHKAIACDLCNCWIHIKCNQLSTSDYEKFKLNPNWNFTCLSCNRLNFPFMALNDDQFNTCVKKGVIINDDLDISLMPTPEQKLLMDKISSQLNSYKHEIDDDEEDDFDQIPNCKYYSTDAFKKENFSNAHSFSILHLNVHSIERHIDEIQVFLDLLKFQFDVLCFSESKIIEGSNPKTSILLEGYQEPLGMPTKATKGGVLIYVKNGITFVPRDGLNMQEGKN